MKCDPQRSEGTCQKGMPEETCRVVPLSCNAALWSFPRKNADLKKKFRSIPDRPARRCTAAVFYPNWWTSRVHHKKGRLRAAISHESRLGKPSFCTFVVRTRPLVRDKTDNSSNTELGKLLGYYPNIQHEMLNRNEAQKRPGIKPSAPLSFQTLPRAQTHPNGCLTLQLKKSQPGATTAAEGSAGTESTTYTSLIPGGPSSPSPWSPTTQDARPTPQQAAPTTLGEAQQERMAQQAQHHSIEKGSE